MITFTDCTVRTRENWCTRRHWGGKLTQKHGKKRQFDLLDKLGSWQVWGCQVRHTECIFPPWTAIDVNWFSVRYCKEFMVLGHSIVFLLVYEMRKLFVMCWLNIYHSLSSCISLQFQLPFLLDVWKFFSLLEGFFFVTARKC